jgi:hypothetical protein
MKRSQTQPFFFPSFTTPRWFRTVLFISSLGLGIYQSLPPSPASATDVKTTPAKTAAPAKPTSTSPQNNTPPTPAPPAELVAWIKQLDEAASRKDIVATLKFYSPSFSHQDGLTYQTWEENLKAAWSNLKTVQYQTQIDRWKVDGPNRYTLETTTTITGLKQSQGRELKLTSTLKARQQVEQQRIVRMEVLSEKTQMVSGAKPPEVIVNLPEQVKVGQSFDFDVVLKDPLGDQLLLGAALEEPISADSYVKGAAVKLEPLTAGGLFKVGRAPNKPTRQWVSAVLVQEGGITVISQRLNVVATLPTPPTKPK